MKDSTRLTRSQAGRGFEVVASSRAGGSHVVLQGPSGLVRVRATKIASPVAGAANRTLKVRNREERQVQVEAARLRQITDKKLGKKTPSWVDRLARKDAPDA